MGPRFRITAPARFQWISGDGQRHEGTGVTRDVSGCGVFVNAAAGPAPGDVVQVIVNMPPLQEEARGTQLYGKGVAVRNEPADECASAGFAAEVIFQPGWGSALSAVVQ